LQPDARALNGPFSWMERHPALAACPRAEAWFSIQSDLGRGAGSDRAGFWSTTGRGVVDNPLQYFTNWPGWHPSFFLFWPEGGTELIARLWNAKGAILSDSVLDLVFIRKQKRPDSSGFWGAYKTGEDAFGVWLFTPRGSLYRGEKGGAPPTARWAALRALGSR
jgi:hypothetical protein